MRKRFERSSEPLLPLRRFWIRLVRHGVAAMTVVAVSFGVGIVGYRVTEGFGWLDSALNAAMILGGMGPVNPIHTVAGKWFAIVYALFSGMIFLVVAGILFAPPLHRLIHRFHLDGEGDEKPESPGE